MRGDSHIPRLLGADPSPHLVTLASAGRGLTAPWQRRAQPRRGTDGTDGEAGHVAADRPLGAGPRDGGRGKSGAGPAPAPADPALGRASCPPPAGPAGLGPAPWETPEQPGRDVRGGPAYARLVPLRKGTQDTRQPRTGRAPPPSPPGDGALSACCNPLNVKMGLTCGLWVLDGRGVTRASGHSPAVSSTPTRRPAEPPASASRPSAA